MNGPDVYGALSGGHERTRRLLKLAVTTRPQTAPCDELRPLQTASTIRVLPASIPQAMTMSDGDGDQSYGMGPSRGAGRKAPHDDTPARLHERASACTPPGPGP